MKLTLIAPCLISSSHCPFPCFCLLHFSFQSSPEVEVTADKAGGPHRPSQSLAVPLDPMDATLPPPPVMEAGEAGPPGKMTATSKLPKGVDGSIMPVKGFAGAPGEGFNTAPIWRILVCVSESTFKSSAWLLFCSTSQRQIFRRVKAHRAGRSRWVNTRFSCRIIADLKGETLFFLGQMWPCRADTPLSSLPRPQVRVHSSFYVFTVSKYAHSLFRWASFLLSWSDSPAAPRGWNHSIQQGADQWWRTLWCSHG